MKKLICIGIVLLLGACTNSADAQVDNQYPAYLLADPSIAGYIYCVEGIQYVAGEHSGTFTVLVNADGKPLTCPLHQ